MPCPPTRSNSVTRTLLNSSIPSCKARRCQHRSTPPLANIRPVKPIPNSMSIDPITLKEDFRNRAEMCMAFFPKLSDTTTQEAISYFQVQITNTVKHMDLVCFYYS